MPNRHAWTSPPAPAAVRTGLDDVRALAAQLGRTPSAGETAGALLAALAAASSASRASLMVVDPATGRLVIAAAQGLPAHVVGQDVASRPRGIAEWVFRNRRALRLEGDVRDARLEGSGPGGLGVDSAVSLPLLAQGAAIGVLNLARHSPAPRFTDAEAEALVVALAPVADCLARVRARELAARSWAALADGAAARCSLMPLGALEVAGYELAFARRGAARVACDVVERVGHERGGHSLLALDVSGAGADAAALAAFVQGLFVALACHERSPAGIVSRIDAELMARHGGRRPARMWVARLSLTGRLEACRAGYPPPAWVPADGHPHITLDDGGPPAGALAGVRYGEERMRLLPGDIVVVTSDGVLEARGAGDQPFGARRVGGIVDARRRMPLDSLCEAILDGAAEWSGRPTPADDAIALALRYTPGDD